ncbi:Alpha/Beta hydrolase protein, partial [Neofusicoccum parvum]
MCLTRLRMGIEESVKLPVLVWIHGGGGSGAGSDPIYDPSRLVLRSLDIGSPFIAVNLNYRLNIFGFAGSADILNNQELAATRGLNFGLYDQKVGLTWVARNIAHFGGDPEQIALGGCSAGSISVHAHVLDAEGQAEKPLFRRALMQSGAQLTLCPMPLAEVEVHWDKLCQHWGVGAESTSRQKVESLRQISAAALLESAIENQAAILPPVADGLTMTMETVAFPPVDLQQEIKPVDYNPMEIMIGTTDVEEAGSFQGDIDLKKVQEVFAKSYPTVEAGAQVLEAYGIVEGSEQSALRAGLVRFLSDAKFDLPIHCTRVSLSARRRAEFGDATSIQPYSVEFGNPFPGPKRGDAHHSVELIYLFDAFHDALVNADNGIFKP